jgi:CheY-like chemotaxis protein
MPRVLVIEDDTNKAAQIADLIRAEVKSVEVVLKGSYQSGLREILLSHVDLVCLDMTLPTYDVTAREKGGRTRPYGGRDILRETQRKGRLVPIVVVTQFESFGEGHDTLTLYQLKEQLSKEFSSNYIGTVFYQAAESRWRDELIDYLLKVGMIKGNT